MTTTLVDALIQDGTTKVQHQGRRSSKKLNLNVDDEIAKFRSRRYRRSSEVSKSSGGSQSRPSATNSPMAKVALHGRSSITQESAKENKTSSHPTAQPRKSFTISAAAAIALAQVFATKRSESSPKVTNSGTTKFGIPTSKKTIRRSSTVHGGKAVHELSALGLRRVDSARDMKGSSMRRSSTMSTLSSTGTLGPVSVHSQGNEPVGVPGKRVSRPRAKYEAAMGVDSVLLRKLAQSGAGRSRRRSRSSTGRSSVAASTGSVSVSKRRDSSRLKKCSETDKEGELLSQEKGSRKKRDPKTLRKKSSGEERKKKESTSRGEKKTSSVEKKTSSVEDKELAKRRSSSESAKTRMTRRKGSKESEAKREEMKDRKKERASKNRVKRSSVSPIAQGKTNDHPISSPVELPCSILNIITDHPLSAAQSLHEIRSRGSFVNIVSDNALSGARSLHESKSPISAIELASAMDTPNGLPQRGQLPSQPRVRDIFGASRQTVDASVCNAVAAEMSVTPAVPKLGSVPRRGLQRTESEMVRSKSLPASGRWSMSESMHGDKSPAIPRTLDRSSSCVLQESSSTLQLDPSVPATTPSKSEPHSEDVNDPGVKIVKAATAMAEMMSLLLTITTYTAENAVERVGDQPPQRLAQRRSCSQLASAASSSPTTGKKTRATPRRCTTQGDDIRATGPHLTAMRHSVSNDRTCGATRDALRASLNEDALRRFATNSTVNSRLSKKPSAHSRLLRDTKEGIASSSTTSPLRQLPRRSRSRSLTDFSRRAASASGSYPSPARQVALRSMPDGGGVEPLARTDVCDAVVSVVDATTDRWSSE